jgi:hypothetical protein
MKRFNENPTRAGRALQIYLILTGYARRRQVLTYGELGRLIGYTHVGVIGRFLGPIMAYCEREGIPALTAIVVNEQTGKPGLGFNTRNKETAELQNETFNFDWFAFYPPAEAELQESTCGEHLAAA